MDSCAEQYQNIRRIPRVVAGDGHKSLYMLTSVYERIGEVRARREVVEYRRPDGRLPGEDLLRGVLGNPFDEIARSAEGQPTLRVVGVRPLRFVPVL